jgi:hypothetical protein
MPTALLVATVLAAAPTPTTLPDRYMALKDVKPGMKGTGKTVLKGTEIVEFQVEVLGVLHNIGPQQDLILVRCAGQGLEETGIIMGMSGSPIYLDGKLIGALAYAWEFSKVPIAGVTPIEEMLAIGSGAEAGPTTREAADSPGSQATPTTRATDTPTARTTSTGHVGSADGRGRAACRSRPAGSRSVRWATWRPTWNQEPPAG